MTVGIVGLGLIGGSFAKAYKNKEFTVFAFDIDKESLSLAKSESIIDDILSPKTLLSCDLVLIALYPEATKEYIKTNAKNFSPECIVIDCCGVKESICDYCFPIAKEFGFTFIGGHPMAGRQFSGFLNSQATMYKGASMILVPDNNISKTSLNKAKELLAPIEFGQITISSAKKHDEIIAFTSQMAHLVSNAYVKSPNSTKHKGFSAGSYKDMTRVAWLNEDMWTELFMENKENLVSEIDFLISSLKEYKKALINEDNLCLRKLLYDGKIKKEAADKV